jgi:Group II intron, maturase-specific domain
LVWKHAKRSMLGPPFSFQVSFTPVQSRATGKLIAMLNPLLRGWGYYHRHVVSKATFQRMDSAIFHCLWWWAKRRHPTKGGRWVKQRYFRTVGNQQWHFYGSNSRLCPGSPM